MSGVCRQCFAPFSHGQQVVKDRMGDYHAYHLHTDQAALKAKAGLVYTFKVKKH